MISIVERFDDRELAALRGIYEREGFDYIWPNANDEIFVRRIVARNGNGLEAAALLRLTGEMYLLMDRTKGNPEDRWKLFVDGHEALKAEMRKLGLEDVHAFIPPNLERAFSKRLEMLGWIRDPWPCYTLRLEH